MALSISIQVEKPSNPLSLMYSLSYCIAFKTWPLNNDLKKHPNAFGTKNLCKIIGCCWKDLISNQWIFDETWLRFVTNLGPVHSSPSPSFCSPSVTSQMMRFMGMNPLALRGLVHGGTDGWWDGVTLLLSKMEPIYLLWTGWESCLWLHRWRTEGWWQPGVNQSLVCKYQVLFYGHMAHFKNVSPASRVVFIDDNPEWTRLKGCPCSSWMMQEEWLVIPFEVDLASEYSDTHWHMLPTI